MSAPRGFGVAGALNHTVSSRLAAAAEAVGYQTFWANDTPGGDGLAALAAAAEHAGSIGLGVGVIPVDRVPAAKIAERVRALGLPEDRLILGIGSGGLSLGARAAVEEAAMELRGTLKARVVVGALGPRMCEIGGRAADGVLLNWLTPGYFPELAALTANEAARNGRPRPWIAAYVRVALAGRAVTRLHGEAERYATFPQYAAHFQRMNVRAVETAVFGDATTIQHGLAAFPAEADEIVVRAIAAEESFESYLTLLEAAAPRAEPSM